MPFTADASIPIYYICLRETYAVSLGMCQLPAGCICSHFGYRLICITFIGRAVVIKVEYFALVCAPCLEQLSDKTRKRPLGTCKSKAHVKVCIVPSEFSIRRTCAQCLLCYSYSQILYLENDCPAKGW